MRARPVLAVPAAVVAALVLSSRVEAQQLRAGVYASGFTAPVAFIQDPSDRDTQFVVEQAGRIRVVRAGTTLPGDFLDLRGQIASGGERGLLGLAFAPDYGLTRRFYVN